jgi:hypothetical protein
MSSAPASSQRSKRTAGGQPKKVKKAAPAAAAAAFPQTLEDLPFVNGYPDVAGYGLGLVTGGGGRSFTVATVKLPAGTYVAAANDPRVASLSSSAAASNVRTVLYEEDDAANYQELVTKKQKKNRTSSVAVKKLSVPVKWLVTTRVIRVGEELVAAAAPSPIASAPSPQEASVAAAGSLPSGAPISAPESSTPAAPETSSSAAAAAATSVPTATNKHRPTLPLLGSAWVVVDQQQQPASQQSPQPNAAMMNSPVIESTPAPSRQVSALSMRTAASSGASCAAAPQSSPTNSPIAGAPPAAPARSASFFGGWVPGQVTYAPRK